jgi:hypothetical protein
LYVGGRAGVPFSGQILQRALHNGIVSCGNG